MPVILLTNDDGIHAEGILELEKEICGLGEIWIVAPKSEKSACGRSVTLHRPLRVEELAPRRFAVAGSPADCVLLAFRTLMPTPPELVIAGINRGLNVGEDIDYSGTVGAASEAALQGSRLSMAVSLERSGFQSGLSRAAAFVRIFVERMLETSLPSRTLLNVNIPANPNSKIRYTRQGNPLERGHVVAGIDPRGNMYYWIAERPPENNPPEYTDRGALKAGCISISLLTLDRNHHGVWNPPNLDRDGFFEDKA